jgi:hypothetical protein
MRLSVLPRVRKSFFGSAGAVLALTAVAKLISAFGTAELLGRPDHLLLLPYRWILLGVAAIELVVVGVLASSIAPKVKLLSLLWLSSSFILYRLAKWVFNVPDPCHCLGQIAANLPMTPETLNLLLKGLIVYLFGGSLALLIGERLAIRLGGSPHSKDSTFSGEPISDAPTLLDLRTEINQVGNNQSGVRFGREQI